jgi:hypothetical protein
MIFETWIIAWVADMRNTPYPKIDFDWLGVFIRFSPEFHICFLVVYVYPVSF